MNIEHLKAQLKGLKIPTMCFPEDKEDFSKAQEKAKVPNDDTIVAFLDEDEKINGKHGIFVTEKGMYWYLRSGANNKNIPRGKLFLSFKELANYKASIEKGIVNIVLSLKKEILNNTDNMNLGAKFIFPENLEDEELEIVVQNIQRFFEILIDVEEPTDISDVADNLRTDYITAYVHGDDADGDADSLNFYRRAFSKFSVNGIDKFAIHWSWSGFLFGAFHLTYRKAYIPALIVFLATAILTPFVPFAVIAFPIACALLEPYLIYLRYTKLMKELKEKTDDEKIEVLKIKGGVNNIIATLIGIFGIIALIILAIFVFRACGSRF